jgi:hypothetical protein
MSFAPESVTNQLRLTAREFLVRMRDHDFEHVWNYMLPLDAIELIAVTSIPLHLQAMGDIDSFLANPSSIQNMSIAFQKNMQLPDDEFGVRTAFFSGISNGLDELGWYELFADEDSHAFFKGTAAVLVADTAQSRRPLFLPFIDEGGRQYRVDFEAIGAFSMEISAQKLHRLATRALEIGETSSALTIYELAARLSGSYIRLRNLIWDHPFVKSLITETRKHELQAEYAYTVLAKDQVDMLRADPSVVGRPIDVGAFLRETFSGYERIDEAEIGEEELQALNAMSDTELRAAVSQVLLDVDPVEANREARKPHGAAEIADMEIAVTRDETVFHLLMPFKSGREIRGESVSVEVFYQILRPHLFFQKGVVVFITAKPCSQFLMNLIKLSRDRIGWPIAVIEQRDLAGILKLNGLL